MDIQDLHADVSTVQKNYLIVMEPGADLMQDYEKNKNNTIPLCLIGGTGRSGTTILKQIFMRHSDCVRVPEYRFSIDPDGLVDFYLSLQNIWSPYYYDLKIRRLHCLLQAIGRNNFPIRVFSHYMHKYRLERLLPFHAVPTYSGIGFSRYSPNFRRLSNKLIGDLTKFSYEGQWNGTRFGASKILHYAPKDFADKSAIILGDFWKVVIDDVCKHQGASAFLEDNTWNILWFDTILELMPHARLVHVIRDPRDVVASYMKMRWAPNDVEKAADWFKGIMERWFEVKKAIPSDSFIEIHLSELVQDPREVIGKVAEFWRLSWNDILLAENLGLSNTGRWKKDFNTDQQKTLNRLLGEYIEKLGYK